MGPLNDRTEEVSSAQIMTIGLLMTTLAAAFVAMGYPMVALAVGPFGLTWLRMRGARVGVASWFLAIGTFAVVIPSVFAHDGWASALVLGGVLVCLCCLAWRKYRPVTEVDVR